MWQLPKGVPIPIVDEGAELIMDDSFHAIRRFDERGALKSETFYTHENGRVEFKGQQQIQPVPGPVN